MPLLVFLEFGTPLENLGAFVKTAIDNAFIEMLYTVGYKTRRYLMNNFFGHEYALGRRPYNTVRMMALLMISMLWFAC